MLSNFKELEIKRLFGKAEIDKLVRYMVIYFTNRHIVFSNGLRHEHVCNYVLQIVMPKRGKTLCEINIPLLYFCAQIFQMHLQFFSRTKLIHSICLGYSCLILWKLRRYLEMSVSCFLLDHTIFYVRNVVKIIAVIKSR